MDYLIGEFSSTRNENGIRHFECVLSCSLPSPRLPSINNISLLRFGFFGALATKVCQGAKNEQTKSSQC